MPETEKGKRGNNRERGTKLPKKVDIKWIEETRSPDAPDRVRVGETERRDGDRKRLRIARDPQTGETYIEEMGSNQ